jgi:hypothetical protein
MGRFLVGETIQVSGSSVVPDSPYTIAHVDADAGYKDGAYLDALGAMSILLRLSGMVSSLALD